jgi:hypothetical protein
MQRRPELLVIAVAEGFGTCVIQYLIQFVQVDINAIAGAFHVIRSADCETGGEADRREFPLMADSAYGSGRLCRGPLSSPAESSWLRDSRSRENVPDRRMSPAARRDARTSVPSHRRWLEDPRVFFERRRRERPEAALDALNPRTRARLVKVVGEDRPTEALGLMSTRFGDLPPGVELTPRSSTSSFRAGRVSRPPRRRRLRARERHRPGA